MLRIGLSRRPYMYQNCLSDRRGSLVYPFSSSSFAEEARAILLSVKCAVSACFIGQLNLRVIFSCASNMPGQELRLSNLNHTDIRSLVRQTLFRCGRSSIRVAFVFDGISFANWKTKSCVWGTGGESLHSALPSVKTRGSGQAKRPVMIRSLVNRHFG